MIRAWKRKDKKEWFQHEQTQLKGFERIHVFETEHKKLGVMKDFLGGKGAMCLHGLKIKVVLLKKTRPWYSEIDAVCFPVILLMDSKMIWKRIKGENYYSQAECTDNKINRLFS